MTRFRLLTLAIAAVWVATNGPCHTDASRFGSGSGSSRSEGSGAAAFAQTITNATAISNDTSGSGSTYTGIFNSSGSRGSGSGSGPDVGESEGNDTITFASLLVAGSHGHGATNLTTTRMKNTSAAASVVAANANKTATAALGGGAHKKKTTTDVERIPIEESSNAQLLNDTATSEPPSLTTTAAPPKPSSQPNASLTKNTTELLSSSSSSSNGSSTVGDQTDSPPPIVEVHGVPSPPTLVAASASDGRAEVSWQTPDDDGSDPILEYEVAWTDQLESKVAGTKIVALTPGSVVVAIIDVTSNASSSSASGGGAPQSVDLVPTTTIISPLINGRSYTFKVRAKNMNGYSTWSAKSLAVSPLHPPDLCGRVTCSGHGTCFPFYQQNPSVDRALMAAAAASVDGQCICRPGFNPPDCSVQNTDTKFVWKVSEWGQCTSGCGGGQRTRTASCWDVLLDQMASSDSFCLEKKPSLTRICNGMECGSKLVSVRYQVETSYDEVLFSPESWDAFELAFTTEVASALQIPRTRLEITAVKRGSIVVFFQILPASRVGEQSLNDLVELLQMELANASSTLRSRGTFARRVETNGVKLSFSLADQTVAGGAEDISIAGLVGTVVVLCGFVALFGWFLRKRHERITGQLPAEKETSRQNVLGASRSDMKRMGIRTMA